MVEVIGNDFVRVQIHMSVVLWGFGFSARGWKPKGFFWVIEEKREEIEVTED